MLLDRTIPVPETGCMLWEGCWHPRSGYGRTYNGGNKPTVAQAHRAVWEEINGPIPEGMKLLHKCDTPPCCNPQHLFLGTQTDNMRDMSAKMRGNMQKKTHCPKGHAYEGENLRIDSNGARVCVTCSRLATAASYAKYKTHCILGHELIGSNIRIDTLGRRRCGVCHPQTGRRFR